MACEYIKPEVKKNNDTTAMTTATKEACTW